MGASADRVRALTHRDGLRLYNLSPALRSDSSRAALTRVSDILGDVRIEDLPLDSTAVATDLSTGEEWWFLDGPLDAARRASLALPGFMTIARRASDTSLGKAPPARGDTRPAAKRSAGLHPLASSGGSAPPLPPTPS
jgi:hypothetical protein